MDFSNPHRDAPITSQVLPRTVFDLGTSLVTLTAAGAATTLSSDSGQRGKNEINTSSKGLRLVVDLTKNAGTIDVVVTIQSYDRGTGKYIDRLASASLTATGTTEYIVHPDLTAAANSIAKNFLGEEWRVQVVSGAGITPDFDLAIGACYLP